LEVQDEFGHDGDAAIDLRNFQHLSPFSRLESLDQSPGASCFINGRAGHEVDHDDGPGSRERMVGSNGPLGDLSEEFVARQGILRHIKVRALPGPIANAPPDPICLQRLSAPGGVSYTDMLLATPNRRKRFQESEG
jgi:hypothetical protein